MNLRFLISSDSLTSSETITINILPTIKELFPKDCKFVETKIKIMENPQMPPNPRLCSLQLELLKVYSFDPSENELIEIRKILAKFFAERLSMRVDKAVEIKGISQQEIDNWLIIES